MKKIFFTLSILVIFLSLSSCKGGKHAPQTETSNADSELTNSNQKPGTSNSKPSSASPTYINDIKPVFEKSCLPCHDKGSALGNWLDYKTVSNKKALIKNRVFEKKDMPLGKPLSENQRTLIAKWVDMGAPEGSYETDTPVEEAPSEPVTPPVVTSPEPLPTPQSEPTLEPTTENITFIKDIKPLFEKYCSTCHNENSGPIMPNWLQYDIVVLKKDSLIDRVIVKKDMPLEGMPSPTAEERELLNIWIQKGMKYEIK